MRYKTQLRSTTCWHSSKCDNKFLGTAFKKPTLHGNLCLFPVGICLLPTQKQIKLRAKKPERRYSYLIPFIIFVAWICEIRECGAYSSKHFRWLTGNQSLIPLRLIHHYGRVCHVRCCYPSTSSWHPFKVLLSHAYIQYNIIHPQLLFSSETALFIHQQQPSLCSAHHSCPPSVVNLCWERTKQEQFNDNHFRGSEINLFRVCRAKQSPISQLPIPPVRLIAGPPVCRSVVQPEWEEEGERVYSLWSSVCVSLLLLQFPLADQ